MNLSSVSKSFLLDSLVKLPVEEAQLNWLMYGTRQWTRPLVDLLCTLALVDGDSSTMLTMATEEAQTLFSSHWCAETSWCAHISLYPDWTCFVFFKEKRPAMTDLSRTELILPHASLNSWMLLQAQCSSSVKGRILLTILDICIGNKECMFSADFATLQWKLWPFSNGQLPIHPPSPSVSLLVFHRSISDSGFGLPLMIPIYI